MSDPRATDKPPRRWWLLLTLSILGIALATTALWQLLLPDVYYSIAVRNHTNEGVIIYPAKKSGDDEPNTTGEKWRIPAGIPGVGDDIVRIPAFELFDVRQVSNSEDYSDDMPAELRIRWQKANLSDCREIEDSSGYKRTIRGEVKLDDGKTYVRRRGCDWQPYGPMRKFSVSSTRIRSSEAYEKVEDIHFGFMAGVPVLDITFVFDDEGVHAETGWGYSP